MSRADERKYATELGVMDARTLINAKFSRLAEALTPAQIDQIQRQLDADVINSAIDRQMEENDQKSIVGRTSTGVAVRDPSKATPFKARMTKIVLKESDTLIRVDYRKLLSPDAFTITSDNPDEATYLLKMKSALEAGGVWLRFVVNKSQIARTTYAMNDPQRWLALLWFGRDTRDEIKTSNGRLTRNALLSIPPLGSGYYHYVSNGPTLRFLNTAIDSVQSKINLVRKLHNDWDPADAGIRARILEWGIVKGVGEGMLGLSLNYPSKSIWTEPTNTLMLARKSQAAGKLTEASKLAAFAAIQAEWGARAVMDYANFINATKGAAGFVLQVLQVLDKLGDIADAILIVRSVGKRLIRRFDGITTLVTEEAPRTIVPKRLPEPRPVNHSPSAYGPTHLPGFQEEELAYENTINRANATLDSASPRIASGDRYIVAEWDRMVAKQKELSQEIRAYQNQHKTMVPMSVLNEMTDRLDRKYGFPTLAERMGIKK